MVRLGWELVFQLFADFGPWRACAQIPILMVLGTMLEKCFGRTEK